LFECNCALEYNYNLSSSNLEQKIIDWDFQSEVFKQRPPVKVFRKRLLEKDF